MLINWLIYLFIYLFIQFYLFIHLFVNLFIMYFFISLLLIYFIGGGGGRTAFLSQSQIHDQTYIWYLPPPALKTNLAHQRGRGGGGGLFYCPQAKIAHFRSLSSRYTIEVSYKWIVTLDQYFDKRRKKKLLEFVWYFLEFHPQILPKILPRSYFVWGRGWWTVPFLPLPPPPRLIRLYVYTIVAKKKRTRYSNKAY